MQYCNFLKDRQNKSTYVVSEMQYGYANIPEHHWELGSKGPLALDTCCEAGNKKVLVDAHVVGSINKVCQHLTHILGISACVDGLDNKNLFLWLEVLPLLADPRLCIIFGILCSALPYQVSP